MNEKLIEKKLREGVQKMGGLALKFSSQTVTGVPDRVVLMPGGYCFFVELKSTGKNPTSRQLYVIARLRSLGFRAEIIDSQVSLDSFLKFLTRFAE